MVRPNATSAERFVTAIKVITVRPGSGRTHIEFTSASDTRAGGCGLLPFQQECSRRQAFPVVGSERGVAKFDHEALYVIRGPGEIFAHGTGNQEHGQPDRQRFQSLKHVPTSSWPCRRIGLRIVAVLRRPWGGCRVASNCSLLTIFDGETLDNFRGVMPTM
jgi:hypothetical protein